MGPKKNSKGKAAGSGCVTAARREKFRQKGLLRENENMGKEDQKVDWEEDGRKGNKKPKLLSEAEVAKFFEPKEPKEPKETKEAKEPKEPSKPNKPKEAKKEETKEEDEGPLRPPGVWDFKDWSQDQKKKQEEKKKDEESKSLDKREKEPAKKEPAEGKKLQLQPSAKTEGERWEKGGDQGNLQQGLHHVLQLRIPWQKGFFWGQLKLPWQKGVFWGQLSLPCQKGGRCFLWQKGRPIHSFPWQKGSSSSSSKEESTPSTSSQVSKTWAILEAEMQPRMEGGSGLVQYHQAGGQGPWFPHQGPAEAHYLGLQGSASLLLRQGQGRAG